MSRRLLVPEVWRRIPSPGPALALYLALSFCFFGKMTDWTRGYVGRGADPLAYVWFLDWWPFAATHGLNPFVAHYVWFPNGANMTWMASVPLAALVAWPVTAFGGAVLSFNLLSVTAPAFAAWTGFFLARYLVRDGWAALVAGYLFGFSSYEIGQMLGHLNLDIVFLVPLVALICVKRVRGEIGRTAFIAVLAAILLMQLALSTEILATVCFCGATVWLIFLLCVSAADRPGLWRLALEIPIAAATVVIAAAPFFFYLVQGLPDVPPEINSTVNFSADLLNYVMPTPVTLLGGTAFSPMSHRFTGNVSEQGAYLGLPLLLVMVLAAWRRDLRRSLAPVAIAATVLAVFSLGPWLHVAGLRTDVPLPWWLGDKLPLIRSALPVRFSLYVALLAAVAAAAYLASAGGRGRGWRFVLAGVACLSLVPDPATRPWTVLSVPPFFTPEHVEKALGRAANVLLLPFAARGDGMAWQVVADLRFTQSAGYVGFWPYREVQFALLLALQTDTVTSDFENDLAAFCDLHRVDAILIGPGEQKNAVARIEAIGWPLIRDEGVTIVEVPPSSALDYVTAEGDYWPSPASAGWMGREIRVINHGRPAILTLRGTWRPMAKPALVTVAGAAGKTTYRVAQETIQEVPVPADAVLTVTADEIFVPEEVLHNGDLRRLSVALSLGKVPR